MTVIMRGVRLYQIAKCREIYHLHYLLEQDCVVVAGVDCEAEAALFDQTSATAETRASRAEQAH